MAHSYNTNKATLTRARSSSGRDLSVVVPSGATLLVCMVVVEGLTARTGGAPTWVNGGANPAFSQADQNRFVASTGETIVELWYLLNPTAGTFNIHIPDDNNMYFAADACSFSAAAGKATTLRTANGATGTSTNPAGPALSGTLTGDVVLAIVGDGATTWAPSNRTANQLYDTDNGTWGHGSQYLIRATDATTTLTWTEADTEDWAIVSAAFKEVTTYTPLAAGIGSFPLSGTAAGFVRSYVFGAATKSFPLSGTAAILGRQLVLGATTKSFPFSGTAANFLRSLALRVGTQSFPFSGTAAGTLYNRRLAVDGTPFPFSGTDVTLSVIAALRNLVLAADTLEFPLSGTAAGLLRAYRLPSDTRSFALSGTATRLLFHRLLSSEIINFPWSGSDVTFSISSGEAILAADRYTFPFSGTAAGLLVHRLISAGATDFPLTGIAALLQKRRNVRYERAYLIKA